MNRLISSITSVLPFLLLGCYTQFSTLEPPSAPNATGANEADSVVVVSDTSKNVDTIVTRDNQVCVWERDLLGYPHLRCFTSYFPQSYYNYNYSSWWDRDDPYWPDYDRCPRYYFFDQSCGCCRYINGDGYGLHGGYHGGYHGGGYGGGYHDGHHGNGGGSGSNNGNVVPDRNRSPGVSGGGSSSGGQLNKSSGDSSASQQESYTSIRRGRSPGVVADNPPPANEPLQKSGGDNNAQTQQSQPVNAQSDNNNTEKSSSDQKQGRRNPRSW